MSKKRVVITGIGTVNPVANNLESTIEGIFNGKSGIELITRFDATDHKTKIAGEVKNFDYLPYVNKKEARRMDYFTILGLCAADQAVSDSGIDFASMVPEETGIVIGTGMGGIDTFEKQHQVIMEKGPSRVSPFFIPMLIPDILPGYISMRHQVRGDNFTTVSACASSAHAIGVAYEAVSSGKQKAMITGGAESTITPLAVAGFNSSKSLSTRNDAPNEASRPFDKERDGFIMSEGAAIIIIEEYEHAKQRNAHIYAEIAGYGFSGDAFHITAPHENGEGAHIAMTRALKSGGINIEQIGHINAHGTSTYLNDKVETLAIKRTFKDHAKKLKICSTKGMTGHMLGSAGAMETVITSFALQKQVIPPTVNYTTPDPECDLDYNPNQASDFKFEYALSNSFGFGGHNASILLKKI